MAERKKKKAVKVVYDNAEPKEEKTRKNNSDEKAKALATILAALLIPTAFIVWNYSNKTEKFKEKELENLEITLDSKDTGIESDQKLDITVPDELVNKNDSVTYDDNTEKEGFLQKVKKYLVSIGIISESEEKQEETTDQEELSYEEVSKKEESAMEEQKEESTADETGTLTTEIYPEELSVKGDVEITETSTGKKLDDLVVIPNTSGNEYYVQEGDNVYTVSMKLCGNNSYYLNNLNKDYLKVGSLITVDCH